MNAKMSAGIGTILEITDFEKKLEGIDLVITGEGKLDAQTLEGKVVKGVADCCTKKSVPVQVICGSCELDTVQIKELGTQKVETILTEGISIEKAIQEAKQRVEEIAFQMMKNL